MLPKKVIRVGRKDYLCSWWEVMILCLAVFPQELWKPFLFQSLLSLQSSIFSDLYWVSRNFTCKDLEALDSPWWLAAPPTCSHPPSPSPPWVKGGLFRGFLISISSPTTSCSLTTPSSIKPSTTQGRARVSAWTAELAKHFDFIKSKKGCTAFAKEMEKQLDLNWDDDHLRGKKSRQGSKRGGHDQSSTLQLASFVLVLVNTAKVVEVNVEDMELEAKSFRVFILCSCWLITLQLLFRTSKWPLIGRQTTHYSLLTVTESSNPALQIALCPSLQPGFLISLGRLVTSFGSHWQDKSRANSASTLNSHQPDQPPLGHQPNLTLGTKDHSTKASDSLNKQMTKIAKKNNKKGDFCRLLVIYLFVVVTSGHYWRLDRS